ncbi:NB-ARC domains-containing protein [Tanacetum coccineum]
MKLRYCCNLTTTPDFSEITNLEELILEGCENLVSVHPSIGMLKRLVVLNLTGCLKVEQLPEALGQIKSLTELHVDKTAITELPSCVSSLLNLESLSFGGQGRIQSRWWTFGLLSKQKQPQRPVSFAGLHMLKCLNISYCNLFEVPESIGGLSCLEILNLSGNNFTTLPGNLRQLSHLQFLHIDGCKKLEVLSKLPPNLDFLHASDCTLLREVSGSFKDQLRYNDFTNCPKLFKSVTSDSEGSITSHDFIHQLSAFLGYVRFETNRCEFFSQDTRYSDLDILYHGNSIPEWFRNRSRENHVKVELPSDWCFNKFRGFGTCVVFKCKKPSKLKGYSIKNFDRASIKENYFPGAFKEFLKREAIGTQDSYMIWLHYTNRTWKLDKAIFFVSFSFFEKNNEDVEVKECGVRLICDEDIQQGTHLSMLQGLPTQHGGMLRLFGWSGDLYWAW